MKSRIFVALAGLAFAGCHANAPEGEEPGGEEEIVPIATVETVKLEKGPIAETIVAYGSVVAQPDELESISVQYECKVARLLVTAGEPVEVGASLIEIELSPDAKLMLAEAKSAADASQKQLEETQRRFDLNLAVNQELQLALQAARDTAAKLASLEARGATERATLKADIAGVVASIDVRIGHIVPAGSPLLAIVPTEHIEVMLGVEPENAGSLVAGQRVRLAAVSQEGVNVDGKVRLITRRVNPTTRLVDTFVSVPPESALLLDGYVRGEIEFHQEEALVVPRGAVLPGEEGEILFTVVDGHAVEHKVTTGIETETQSAVTGETLKEGDEVITSGNYVVEDGMEVKVSN